MNYMPKKQLKLFKNSNTLLIRTSYGILLCILILASAITVALLKSKEFAFDIAVSETTATQQTAALIFPLGVNPSKELITENPSVDLYMETHLSKAPRSEIKISWLRHAIAKLAQLDWYQNLASPLNRILVIEQGERKEQVVDNFGDILRWDATERKVFEDLIASSTPELAEGKFFPGHYVVTTQATPEDVAQILINQFNTQIASRYSEEIQKVVPMKDALTLASLLEREAYDFEDMRFISGIIWNRLFIDMNLQLDASLQYAKANAGDASWWPVVRPEDKYIRSPFNTYKNKGLPPSPIANPSTEAIIAALNPKRTECIFYFHDRDGGFHCTKTYEEHVALIKQFYGKEE